MRTRHPLARAVRRLLFASMLPPVVAVSAQSRPATDALSGSWSGYIGRSEASPSSVSMTFKLATDRTVSGSVTGPQIEPGEINGGTFDPATGALKFTVVLLSGRDKGGNVAFDGRVARDTASGTMLLGGETGVFRLTKDASAARGAPAKSATKPATASASEANATVRRSFIEVSDWIVRAAALVPAEKYAYRPVSTVRTFGQLVGHLVDGSNYYCARAAGREVQWSDSTEKHVTSKPALVQALKQALARCGATYDGSGQLGALMNNVGHSSLHYGNMVTYIRMMGLTPPSS